MSDDYMEKAEQWYKDHTEHVKHLIKTSNINFPIRPSLEDLSKPELWKGMHWIWFLEERNK